MNNTSTSALKPPGTSRGSKVYSPTRSEAPQSPTSSTISSSTRRPAGTSSARQVGGGLKQGAGRSSRSSRQEAKPPLTLFILSVFMLLATLAIFVVPYQTVSIPWTSKDFTQNSLGYVTGSFISIFLLSVFLYRDNQARATLRYSDWSLVSPRRIVPWVTCISWILAAVHLFFWAMDLTRL